MHPLGLPVGSVRAILAIALTLAVIVGFLAGRAITGSELITGEQIVTLATLAVGFYFMKRDGAAT